MNQPDEELEGKFPLLSSVYFLFYEEKCRESLMCSVKENTSVVEAFIALVNL